MMHGSLNMRHIERSMISIDTFGSSKRIEIVFKKWGSLFAQKYVNTRGGTTFKTSSGGIGSVLIKTKQFWPKVSIIRRKNDIMWIFFQCKEYMHCAIEQKVEKHVWFAYIFQLFEVQNRMWSRWGVQSGHPSHIVLISSFIFERRNAKI